MAAEDEVRAASAEFYAGLNRMLAGDASSLGAIGHAVPPRLSQ